jgi:hypothetical protein
MFATILDVYQILLLWKSSFEYLQLRTHHSF